MDNLFKVVAKIGFVCRTYFTIVVDAGMVENNEWTDDDNGTDTDTATEDDGAIIMNGGDRVEETITDIHVSMDEVAKIYVDDLGGIISLNNVVKG